MSYRTPPSPAGRWWARLARVLLQAGVDYRLVYLTLLVPLATLVAAFAAPIPEPRIGGATATDGRTATRPPPVDLGAKAAPGTAAPRPQRSAPVGSGDRLSRPSGRGRAWRHWSGIYLRDTLGLAAIVGGSGVAVFYGRRRWAGSPSGGSSGAWEPPHAARLRPADGGRDAARARHHEPRTRHRRVPARGHGARRCGARGLLGGRRAGAERAGSAVSVVTTFGYGGFLRAAARGGPCGGGRPQRRPRRRRGGRPRHLRALTATSSTEGGHRDRRPLSADFSPDQPSTRSGEKWQVVEPTLIDFRLMDDRNQEADDRPNLASSTIPDW